MFLEIKEGHHLESTMTRMQGCVHIFACMGKKIMAMRAVYSHTLRNWHNNVQSIVSAPNWYICGLHNM